MKKIKDIWEKIYGFFYGNIVYNAIFRAVVGFIIGVLIGAEWSINSDGHVMHDFYRSVFNICVFSMFPLLLQEKNAKEKAILYFSGWLSAIGGSAAMIFGN
ncbi:hypothetical protein AGMMS50239_25980 [Bacteroidia bacterium]|nr:hypothetical protein AGMMS50239_25980 [Bacteroidia bacterium]